MSRPKKHLDVAFVVSLHSQGLSLREIAAKLGTVSYSRVYSELKNSKKTPPPSEIVELKNSKKTDKKTPHVVASKKTHQPPQNNSISCECLPNTTPSASLKAHNAAFSLAYVGTQPVSIKKFVLNSRPYYRFDYDNDAVFAYKNRILVWVNGVKGTTPDETEGRARGRARAVLAEFAREKGVKPAWEDFGGVTSPHFTVEDKELNDFLLKEPDTLRINDLKPGDFSHKTQVEADTLKGRTTLQSLLMLPEDMKVIKTALSGFVEYNANIKKHLEVLDSMDRTLKEMRRYLNTNSKNKNRLRLKP